ncbi:Formate C-acetyltransferase [Oleispira antarctica RB-8]|mgnify:FL=1|uniref:Formate C-acetyltransferase n=1 Tax=Oleispira antarctica RB-8 TaxID=698738 RepID=R4YU99_OLEAN|nr:Formate C-acetyltransferase [Oleispira antarctica RB-8]
MSDRIEILKNSVNNAIRAICPERAILWTEYYKNKLNRNKPVEIQAAEAMCYVLQNKSIEIYPDELVVGNYTSHRVGGIIYPEKAGLSALAEIFTFHKRKVNPLSTSRGDRFRLFSIIPFWLNRNVLYIAPIKKPLSLFIVRLSSSESREAVFLSNQ